MSRPVPYLVAIALLGLPLPGGAEAADPPAKEEKNRPRLVVQTGHVERIFSVAVSHDGKRVLTGDVVGNGILWDTETGQEIQRFEADAVACYSAALSPDGKWALTGHWDKVARLWDVATGKEVKRFEGHTDRVVWVVFSSDGKQVLTASDDDTARLWDVATGREVKRFEHPKGRRAAISSDGKRVFTGAADMTIRTWDAGTGKELKRFAGETEGATAGAFSPDGKWLLVGFPDKSVRLWDVDSGKEVRKFEGHTDRVQSIAFSPDGKSMLTGSWDQTARLWDLASGKEVKRFTGHPGRIYSVAFSPDGKRAFTGSNDQTARVWDVGTAKELRQLVGRGHKIYSAEFSPDGKLILLSGDAGVTYVWDAAAGKEVRRFGGHIDKSRATFSPDGKWVLTGGQDKLARIRDVATGKEVKRFEGHTDNVGPLAWAPDGKWVLTGSRDSTARLWDVNTGKEVKKFEGHTDWLLSVAISRDGKWAVTGSRDKTARLWDVNTGKEVKRFEGHTHSIMAVAFSPDAKRVLTGGWDETVRLWDAGTGKEVKRLEGHGSSVTAVAWSSDGKRILTGSFDKTVRLWDADTGKELKRFEAYNNWVWSVAFSPDEKRILTGNLDGSARVLDVESGKELCRLINFRDRTWAVVDSAGRFDASKGGDVEGLHWVIGNEAVSLDQLKERYYDPGLLPKHMGFSKEPLRTVENFTDPKLFPTVSVEQPDKDAAKFKVALANRDGGIGRVVVRVNGKEVTSDARPRGSDPNAPTLELLIDLTGDPRLRPGEENLIEVEAYNAGGYLRSRGFQVRYSARGQKAPEPPEVWVLAVGVSRYAGAGLELRFASKDAEDMALGFRVAAGGLFGPQRLHLTVLSSDQKDAASQPTRPNVLGALESLKKARPQDVVVIYFAGHGVNEGGAEGDYYYLCAEARSGNLADPAVRDQVAVSSQHLADLLRQCPAAKQVLILDTCAAGRAVDRLTEKRELPSSQVRALERVKDRTGTHVLAGCAADSVSYEATRYAQGVLTYSLLLGMRGGALKEDQHVDVATLFNFASDRVPELARDLGGIQRPVVASPKGASFPIGLVTQRDQARIPLRPARPLVLQSNFQEEEMFKDVLSLGRRVDERLRAATARGGSERLVFVDAREMPDAYGVFGRYRVEKGKVTVTLRLARGQQKSAAFVVEGEEARPDELADRIGREIEKRLNSMSDMK